MKKSSQILRGFGVSGGITKGKIKFLKGTDLKTLSKDKESIILLIKSLSPEVVLFAKNSSGIIAESGSLTCHGAILVREIGIPCVILENAFKVLSENSIVELNGFNETVSILKRE